MTEDNSRDCGHCSRNPASACNRWRCPLACAIRQIHSGDDRSILVEAVICGLPLDGSAKHDQSCGSGRTFSDIRLPENLPAVGIEGHDKSAFASCDKNVATIGECVQDKRRAAEIVIRTKRLGAVVSATAGSAA